MVVQSTSHAKLPVEVPALRHPPASVSSPPSEPVDSAAPSVALGHPSQQGLADTSPVAISLPVLSAAFGSAYQAIGPANFLRGGLAYLPQTRAEFGLRERRLLSLLMEHMRLILLFLSGVGVPGSNVCLLALAGFVAAAGVEFATVARLPRVWNFTGLPLDPGPDGPLFDAENTPASADGESPPVVSALDLPASQPHSVPPPTGAQLVDLKSGDSPLGLAGLADSEPAKPHAL